MGAFKNITVREYFQRYGYANGMKRGLFMGFPVHAVEDRENRKILYYRKIKRLMEKRYSYAAEKNPEGLEYPSGSLRNPVWVYWKQGIENAPDIVKVCVKSIRDNAQGDVILLDDDSVGQYVRFPEYSFGAAGKKSMSTAHFADILRFSLLEHYGGTWIDATVCLTDSLPETIVNSELFAYRDTCGLMYNPASMAIWLIHAAPGNAVVKETRNILFEYWKRNEYAIEYLITNIVLTSQAEKRPEISAPYMSSDYSRLMLDNLDRKFDMEEYKRICALSSVHKLTYKLNSEVIEDKENLYNKLIGAGASSLALRGGGIISSV